MNPGPTPPNSDDEARDPLLAALHQRLHDYGQAPPPGAWAAIRQQLPLPAAPQPWWRRPRRLLPLLGLLLGLVAVGTLALRHKRLAQASRVAKLQRHGLPILSNNSISTPEPTGYPNHRAQPATAAFSPAASSAALPPAMPPAAVRGRAATKAAAAKLSARANISAALSATNQHFSSKAISAAAVEKPLTAGHSRRLGGQAKLARGASRLAEAEQLRKKLLFHPAGSHTSLVARAGHAVASSFEHAAASVGKAALAGARPRQHATPTNHRLVTLGSELKPATGRGASLPPTRRRATTISTTDRAGTTKTQLAGTAALAFGADEPKESPLDFGLLAGRTVALGLPNALPLPTLPAAPDSAKPVLPVRRWSLLVLAGPALSYRALGPAPTLATQHPDFARLERPALGLGAQVQVRRVLSGRWAVAVGLGYQEYATRLALSLIDSAANSTKSVHQRDVYRMLTLPVQFSYALGAPHGRLAWALLAGAEPSWYQGGRSTEGSDCGCQQRVYPADSAKTSPYRPLSFAFSLGLDLRYRLGGSASRWQWVVQPTARYVATPFVRSEAVGFTRRHPWSLGLLTGISWDFR